MIGRALTLVATLLGTVAGQEPEGRARAAFASGDPAWVGQRIVLRVDLSSSTGFAGVPRFEIPELPGVLIAKVGGAVVGSETIDGATWSVQTHEFALFAQQAGELELPAFPVYFEVTSADRRERFERDGRVGGLRTTVRTPPGGDGVRGLVSARRLTVDARWDRAPAAGAQVGDAFVRTVTIEADGVLGMALPELPAIERPGLGVYADRPTAEDRTSRGEFVGVRVERVTVVCEAAGRVSIPSVRIPWFDLDAGAMDEAVVPGVEIDVAPAPASAGDEPATTAGLGWWIGVAVLLVVALLARRRIVAAHGAWRARQAQGEPAFFRRVIAACRTGDPARARAELYRWLDRRATSGEAPTLAAWIGEHPELEHSLADLERACAAGSDAWSGGPLAAGLRRVRSRPAPSRGSTGALPPLNPPV